MKLIRFGALTAVLAGTALIGCSSEHQPQVGENDSSVTVNLTTPENVVITQIHWELHNAPVPGSLVFDDYLATPGQTIPPLSIESLAFGSYYLEFDAEGSYDPDGAGPLPAKAVPCTSVPADGLFSISAAAPNYTFPSAIKLTCNLEVAVNNTGSVNASVEVEVETIPVGNVTEPFSHGNSAVGADVGGACVYPTIPLKVFANPANGVTYTWTDNDASGGTFSFTNASNTVGSYLCGSGGTKTITLTGTTAASSNSVSFDVTCDDSACNVSCGDGVVNQASEECDDTSAHCQGCIVVPSCGDGIIDGPNGNCANSAVNKPECDEECDDAGPSATCTAECVSIAPFCGDGNIDTALGEVCDDGAANSNTAPDACRTPSCQPASCGDTVTDSDEECDDGTAGSATCTPACTLIPLEVQCDDCIREDADLGAFQVAYCDPFATCAPVQNCAADTGCFLPVPAACYCGPNTDGCRAPAFVPVGDCVNQVRAAATTTGETLDNATILDRFFDQNYPLGAGMLAYDQARQGACADACLP